MDARAFKILKALLGCGRSPDKAETTGPNQKQTKSEADNDVRCCHPGGGAMASTMSRIRPTIAKIARPNGGLAASIQSALLLNGGASIALLAFLGNLAIAQQNKGLMGSFLTLKESFVCFGVGVMLAASSNVVAFLIQVFQLRIQTRLKV